MSNKHVSEFSPSFKNEEIPVTTPKVATMFDKIQANLITVTLLKDQKKMAPELIKSFLTPCKSPNMPRLIPRDQIHVESSGKDLSMSIQSNDYLLTKSPSPKKLTQ